MHITFPTKDVLNRYTSLLIALDAYFLGRYREEMRFRSVLAICFSMRTETFHQWRVFSNGSSGVCIEFDRSRLLASVENQEGFRIGEVSYHLIRDLQKTRPDLEKWPFLKRKPFKDETEFRIVFESEIDLGAVRRVTLSPWLPEPVAASVTAVIRSIKGCAKLGVNRSTLIDNAGWRSVVD